MQEHVKTFLILIQLWIVTKTIVVSLASLNQFFRQFTRICCFLSKLAPQEWFQHLPPVLNTDASTSHNAHNSSIRSTCASADLSLDTQDEEIWNILEELQGSANPRVESTEQCRLTGNFVSDNVFNLSNKVLIDTEIKGTRERSLFCTNSK